MNDPHAAASMLGRIGQIAIPVRDLARSLSGRELSRRRSEGPIAGGA